MDIKECDENRLMEELADRGIDARTIREFSTQELHTELDKREEKQERDIQAQHDAEMAQTDDADEIQQALQDGDWKDNRNETR